MLALGALAVVAGLVALVGSSFTFDRASTLRRDSYGPELHDWHLAAILVVFAGLVVSSFAVARLVRQVASLLALGVALAALVAFWWTEIDELLGQSYLDTGDVTLGAGTILGGVALGLQVVVGVLMFTAAFPLSADAGGIHLGVLDASA